MDPRSDNIQSVMYLESAAGSGGILAGGGPSLAAVADSVGSLSATKTG